MEILSLEHYDNRAWLELLPSLADRKSYYTAFSLSIHPRDFFTGKEAAKDNEKNARVLLQRRFIFAPPVNWKSSSINSQHVHFSLYSLPGQGRFFFSMDKEVTHAKNRRRGLWIDCVVVFVREVAAAVYYNGSLAKFFLEMLWEKSLLGYTSNTSHQRDENDIFYDKSWSLAYHAFHFTFCCLPGSS